ncbi:MAG: hypothetical protein JW748_05000 [Anaerolineales bacterium]|nr:hypothetical protein [Anaerolineales bacterium]
MADTRCPMCGKPNPAEANACRYCGARLKPMQPGAATPPAAPPPAAPPPAGGEADWMSDLRGDMMRNRPKTSMLPPEPPAPTQSDDWLKKIDDRGEKKSSAPAAPTRRPGVSLAGTAQPPASPPKSEPPPPAAPEPPAWLSKVRAQVSSERPPAAPAESEKGNEDPAWLKRLRVRRTQDELAPSAPSAPEPEQAAPGELPEWLSKIREKAPGGESPDAGDQSYPASPLAGGSEEPGGSSPWGITAPSQKPRANEPGIKPETGSDIPDWMQYPSGAGGQAGAEPPVGTPDWMGSIASVLDEIPPTPPPAGKPRGTGPTKRPSTSSLLGGAGPADTGPVRGSGIKRGTPTGKIFPAAQPFNGEMPPSAPGSSAFGPDWEFPADAPTEFPFPNPAADPAAPSGSAAFHGGTEPMVAPSGEEELPNWLADAKREPAEAEPEIEEEPALPAPDLNELLRPDTMPDWLKKPAGAGLEGPPDAAPAAHPTLPENLEHAELPRWLEAMRPIQSVAMPTGDEERVESVGPLAGLRGVLSAEPVVAMPHRPGIMAGNIDALPAQMALTETLRRLLIEPEVRAARRPVRAMLLTPVIRKMMSAVLIISLMSPLLFGAIFSNTVYQPQANIQAGQLVEALPADRMVLVAFEYDASSAPEIETGATVMLEHLAQRGVQVVFISSQPNGTVLGDGLLQFNAQLGSVMPVLAADFGYIPGGAGGLRRLGGDLREVIPNPGLNWTEGPLAAVRTISDFSMILIFSAGPQSVRNWVEQVHTVAPGTPMVAMVSAASDALVFPYTQGSQPALRGLVTGYTGAQAYRAHFMPATVPTQGVYAMRWQAFAGGTLALLVTLTAGIIGSLILGYIRRDRRAAE